MSQYLMGCDTILLYKEKTMKTLQITNLDEFGRSLIGFDTLFTELERRFSNQASSNYPPHNVIKVDENQYEIQVAVTGFEKDEITVQVENTVLTVKGESNSVEHEEVLYLHRGLATRDFKRDFPLAEHIEVRGAEIKNGMLIIKLERNVPESARLKIIDIVDVK